MLYKVLSRFSGTYLKKQQIFFFWCPFIFLLRLLSVLALLEIWFNFSFFFFLAHTPSSKPKKRGEIVSKEEVLDSGVWICQKRIREITIFITIWLAALSRSNKFVWTQHRRKTAGIFLFCFHFHRIQDKEKFLAIKAGLWSNLPLSQPK